MRLVECEREDLTVATEITVWRMPEGHSGQGGKVVSSDENGVTLSCGSPDPFTVHFYWSEVHHLTVEQALDADECLNFGADCEGPVDYHTTGSSHRGWPRCDFHQALRDKSYQHSLERYADSDVVPDGFDPADAGESWFED